MEKLLIALLVILSTCFCTSCIHDSSSTQSKPMLTIIDDDGDKHFLTDIVPFCHENDVFISTAVSPHWLEANSSRFMNYNDLNTLIKCDIEILNHSYYHYTGTQIQTKTDDEILFDFSESKSNLFQHGIKTADILVYSSSTGNYERVQNIAKKIFKCGIKIGGSVNNTSKSNRYALSRFRIDYAATEGRSDWNLDDLKSYVDHCQNTGEWMIWMFHTSNSIYRRRVAVDDDDNVLLDSDGRPYLLSDVNGNPIYDNNGTYPHMGSEVYLPILKEAIDYAKLKGVSIVKAETALKLLFGI